MTKIAVLTDSGTDVPADFAKKHGIFSVPLHVNYANGESYLDRVDIAPEEVYRRLAQDDVPKTSTPTLHAISEKLKEIALAGFTHVVAVTISSGLSGTCDAMRLAAEKQDEVTVRVVDTKNIAIGAGLSVMRAASLIAEGRSFDEVVAETEATALKTHVFFCVNTLDYLFEGGRISSATYHMGSILNLRPIITCDEEGKYVPIAKPRGRKKSLAKTVELAQKTLEGSRRYKIAIGNGDAKEEADELVANTATTFPYAEEVFEGQVSPALVVHTGPGLIGIATQRLD